MTAAAEGEGFFVLCEGLYAPTEVQRSPWDRTAQNGVGIGGLLMHLVEQVPTDVPMVNAHMTIDILRPTPFAAIEGKATITRAGRKLQIVEAVLIHDGQVTARGRCLRVRETETPIFEAPPFGFEGPEDLPERPTPLRVPMMRDAMETRVAKGVVERSGRAAIWQRLRWDLIVGVPTTSIVQAAMMSDYGHGISNPIDRTSWISPNVDISMHMSRAPSGEWLALYSETALGGSGFGLTNMTLADKRGVFGRAHQTLFIDRL